MLNFYLNEGFPEQIYEHQDNAIQAVKDGKAFGVLNFGMFIILFEDELTPDTKVLSTEETIKRININIEKKVSIWN